LLSNWGFFLYRSKEDSIAVAAPVVAVPVVAVPVVAAPVVAAPVVAAPVPVTPVATTVSACITPSCINNWSPPVPIFSPLRGSPSLRALFPSIADMLDSNPCVTGALGWVLFISN
jgi:hypothetical protein